MLLDEGAVAADFSKRIARAFEELGSSDEDLVRSALRGKLAAPASIRQARAEVAAYTGLTSHLGREFDQSSAKLQFMVESQVSTRSYLLEARSNTVDPVLLLPVNHDGLEALTAG